MKGPYIMFCPYHLLLKTKRANLSKAMQWFYILWEPGIYSGRAIGELLGLGYSSVSRRAHIIRKRIQKDKVFKKKFNDIKSIIKI